MLLTPGKENVYREQGAEHFINCKHEILGEILHIAAELRRPFDAKVPRELRRQCDLDQWEADLPPYLTHPLEGKGLEHATCPLFVLSITQACTHPNRAEGASEYRLL